MQTVAATGHPYRSKPVARTPLISGRERRLAAHGVSIVLVCLVCRWFALLFSPAVVVAEMLLVLGTWLFTLRCHADNRTTRALGWGLRILATLDSGLAITNSLGISSWHEAHALLAIAVLPVVALLYVATRLHDFGVPKLTRRIVTLIATWLGSVVLTIVTAELAGYLALVFVATALMSYLGLWLWGFALMLGIRRTLSVEAHEWWLDVEALPRVEWTSYARLGDGRIELVAPDGGVSWFDNYADAIFWLDKLGFWPQERALAQGLVDQSAALSLA